MAVLVPPVTMDHVEQIAGNIEKMPPKSTYFYPEGPDRDGVQLAEEGLSRRCEPSGFISSLRG